MEEEQGREQERIDKMKNKYQIGNANKGGAAYNIINQAYERSAEGTYLRQRDDAATVRKQLRSKNIDTLANAHYNVVNGERRRQAEAPYHPEYNPPGASALSRAGAQVFGDGMAGRPVRGMDKQFGKRVASVNGALSHQVGAGEDNNINGGFISLGSSAHRQLPPQHPRHLGPLDQPRQAAIANSQSVQAIPSYQNQIGKE